MASAPPEAELYMGTNAAVGDGIPVASAVPIPDDDTVTGTINNNYSDHPPDGHHHHHHHVVPAHQVRTEDTVYLYGLGIRPKDVTCPFCQHQVRTNIRTSIDLFTVIVMGILFLVFWPVCWSKF